MDNRVEVEVHRANGLYIEMLMDMARHDVQPIFSLVGKIRPELVELDLESRLRVSQRPYLLTDFRFKDDPWWLAVQGMKDEGEPTVWSSHYPRAAAVELARRTLTLVWTVAGLQSSRLAIRLGLSPMTVEIFSRMKLEEIERIAERHVVEMRPRWKEQPAIWRRLIEAARRGDLHALQSIDLHGAQLLARELMGRGG